MFVVHSLITVRPVLSSGYVLSPVVYKMMLADENEVKVVNWSHCEAGAEADIFVFGHRLSFRHRVRLVQDRDPQHE